MGRELDLDAAAAARAEALGESEAPTVIRNGRSYKLTPVLYVDAMAAYLRFNDPAFVELVLDDPNEAEDFILGRSKNGKTTAEHRLQREDITAMLNVWGLTPGESDASDASSTNGGTRSRRTSTKPTA